MTVREQSDEGMVHRASTGRHSWLIDEPLSAGGDDLGGTPYDILLSALGACTSMTMRMYARRKGWDYAPATVTLRHRRVHARDCATCETTQGMVDQIDREITLDPEPERGSAAGAARDCRQVSGAPHSHPGGPGHDPAGRRHVSEEPRR